MIWADREAKKIKEKGSPREWVDDMKTPSGRVHFGSLRGIVIHDIIYKALKEIEVKVGFSYVFNDMDPLDTIPPYLNKKHWSKYLGMPLYRVPSPVKGYSSFAHYFAQEFIEVFLSINCQPKIFWSSQLYRSGKMDQIIREFLKNVKKVREIYQRVAKAKKPSFWFPYHPVCHHCGKIGTTDVHHWDGQFVYYRCQPRLVSWAQGCGYEGKVEPVGENGKLPWKVDWPGHWRAIGVTIESAGKDHMSAGGSYEIASHLAQEILDYPPPETFGGYEWFTIGGKKMSSSKGIGVSAKEVSEFLPPSLLRFLIARIPIQIHFDFNPYGQTIPRLYDEYDRCLGAYFDKIEGKIPAGKKGEVIVDLARIVEFSQVSPLPKKRLFLPRFKTIVNLIDHHKEDQLKSFFKNQKGKSLTLEENQILEERYHYAKIYLEKYSLSSEKNSAFSSTLNENQKKFLLALAQKLEENFPAEKDQAQAMILKTIHKLNTNPREAFSSIYLALTGKTSGPRAGELIVKLGKEKTLKKIFDLKDQKHTSDNGSPKFTLK
ncbi:MAG: lysine--tRNA ligase [Patescibacteria group bacterium]|nr:lysine--tRNA ligase [Patescibacteria group bacterium]